MNIFQAFKLMRKGCPVRVKCNKKVYMILKRGKLFFQNERTGRRYSMSWIFFELQTIFSKNWEHEPSFIANKELVRNLADELKKSPCPTYEPQYTCDFQNIADSKQKTYQDVRFVIKRGDCLGKAEKRRLNVLDYAIYTHWAKMYTLAELICHMKKFPEFCNQNNWNKNDFVIFAEDRYGNIVGACYWSYNKDNEECMLHGICVDQDHRNKGIGRRLLLFALKNMDQEYPGKSVSLTVQPGDLPAINLYRSVGFDTTAYTRLVKKGKKA